MLQKNCEEEETECGGKESVSNLKPPKLRETKGGRMYYSVERRCALDAGEADEDDEMADARIMTRDE